MIKKDIKILLLQIRKDTFTREIECQNFIKYSGLQENQFTVLNVFDTPEFTPDVIDGNTALFIGGSSDASARKPETYRFLSHGTNLIKYCYEKNIPIFASCFGFQMVGAAFGGTLIEDINMMEMGTLPIIINQNCKNDLLFHDTPSPFHAVLGHKEHILDIPSEFIVLSRSQNHNIIHAFKHKTKPIYAFQFHAELDKPGFVKIINHFKDYYFKDEKELEKSLSNLLETPESQVLISKFIERIILK